MRVAADLVLNGAQYKNEINGTGCFEELRKVYLPSDACFAWPVYIATLGWYGSPRAGSPEFNAHRLRRVDIHRIKGD